MQRDLGGVDAAFSNALQDFLSEMQTGGGCGDRTARSRINSLVTLAILLFSLAGGG